MSRIVQAIVVVLVLPWPAWADGDWYGLTYLGQYSSKKYDEVPFARDWDLKQQYMACLGLGREMTRIDELWGMDVDIGVELEGLAAEHWGRYNRHYEEFVFATNLRWHKFPWNDRLPTTFGHGFGLSYTTRVPEQEVIYRRGRSAKLLGFLMWELTFSHPSHPQWAAFFRIHHRSGAYGLFSGVHGAANYPCIGIKYSF